MNQILSVLDCASYPARLMADEFKFRISMFALLVALDGCVSSSIVAQGVAGTFSLEA